MQEEMDRALAFRSSTTERGGRQSPNVGGGTGAVDYQQHHQLFVSPASSSAAVASRGRGGTSTNNWSRRNGGAGSGGTVNRRNNGGSRKVNSDRAEAAVARELGAFYSSADSEDHRENYPRQWRQQQRYADSGSGGFYNKEVYMQANCQFIVKATVANSDSSTEGSVSVDYTAYMKDPDLLVAWELVEEVRAPAAASSNCPICLFRPRAAKVTKCGHAYCHPCALQYIGYENAGRSSKKCAICAEHIYPADLRSLCPIIADCANAGAANYLDGDSVAIGDGGSVRVGEAITMLLMRRLKGDNRVMPVELLASSDHDGEVNVNYGEFEGEKLSPPRLSDCPPAVAAFAKLITASAEDVAKLVVSRELAELAELQSEADAEQLEFVRAARRATLARLGGALAEAASTTSASSAASAAAAAPPQRMQTPPVASSSISNAAHADVDSSLPSSSAPTPPAPGPARRAKLTSVCEEPAHYFYQVADGRHVYLHSLNWQCLAWQYGGIANCPHRITANVLHVEQLSVTPALRKRAAHLRHLPLTCSLAIAELDLGPPLLSRRCLNEFSRQLDERRRQRQALARQERQLTRRRDAEDRRLMGAALDLVVTASAMNAREPRENPAFTEADPPLLAAVAAAGARSPTSASANTAGGGVRSFAQAAAAWPAKSSTASAAAAAAPGTAATAAAAAVSRIDDADDESNAPKPLTSLGDALGALLAAATEDTGGKRQQRRKKQKAAATAAARSNFFKEQLQLQNQQEKEVVDKPPSPED